MKKEVNFVITAETTLGEVISLLVGIFFADKTPTWKYLRENFEVLAEAEGCTLYENGYFHYDNGCNSTVMSILSCTTFTYRFLSSEIETLPEGLLESLPWYVALILVAEHRIEDNSMNNRQGGRRGSKDFKFDDAGDRAGDAEAVIERAYHTSNIWREDCVGENPESIFIREETRREILASMTEKQRKVFLLFFQEGYKQVEIAKLLRIGRTTVQGHLYAAVRKARLID